LGGENDVNDDELVLRGEKVKKKKKRSKGARHPR